MCAGSAAYKTQRNQYIRNLKAREVKWAGARNVWNAKLANYDKQMAENVLAHSRQVGAIQRDYGLEKSKYLKANEDAYRKLVATAFVNEGGRARGAGRNQRLKGLYGDAARAANLQRKGVQTYERLMGANRQLISMNNKALTRRGLAPIPGVAPAAPSAPGMLEWGFSTASQVAGILSAGGAGSQGGFLGTGILPGE